MTAIRVQKRERLSDNFGIWGDFNNVLKKIKVWTRTAHLLVGIISKSEWE